MKISRGGLIFDVTEAGPENGEPVILLHGFPQSRLCWAGVIDALHSANVRLYAPDQRGYSPGARPTAVSAYQAGELVGDILGLVDALELDSAHLVGHDWGSALAWRCAAEHPDRVRTLTAVSMPHPAAFGWALRHDPDQKERSEYISLLRRAESEHTLLDHDARVLRTLFSATEPDGRYIEHLSRPGALTAALNWYRAMTSDFAHVASVTVPTTYIWSNADPVIGRVGAERTAGHVEGPYRFVELDGTSHWIPEVAPELLAVEIAERVALSRDG